MRSSPSYSKGLQAAGYETDILSTVEEATSVLLTTFYAALILDLGLPDGDGLAISRSSMPSSSIRSKRPIFDR